MVGKCKGEWRRRMIWVVMMMVQTKEMGDIGGLEVVQGEEGGGGDGCLHGEMQRRGCLAELE